MIKLSKLEREGKVLNLIKGTYEKPTANISLNRNTKGFLPKVRTRQGCLRLPFLFNIVICITLASTLRHQDKEQQNNLKAASLERKKKLKLY